MKFIAKNADFSANNIEKEKVLIYSSGDNLPLEWICDDEKPLSGATINGKWLTLQQSKATNGQCMAVIRGTVLTPLLNKKINVKVSLGVMNSQRLVFWPSDELKPLKNWEKINSFKIYEGTYAAIASYLEAPSETLAQGDFVVPEETKMIVVLGYKYNSATLVKSGISVTAAEDIYD